MHTPFQHPPREPEFTRPTAWQLWLCGENGALGESSVEAVALRYFGIIGAASVVALLPASSLSVVNQTLAVCAAFAGIALWLFLVAVLWWAGAALLRSSPQRHGKILVIKIVCIIFLVLMGYGITSENGFQLKEFSFLYSVVEMVYVFLMVIYLSFAISSRTLIPALHGSHWPAP